MGRTPAEKTCPSMTNQPKNWKIGAVSYFNTRPLVFGLEQGPARQGLEFDLPSHLADKLASGLLDVALIPSIEVFQHPDYTVVSNACIACHGPVWSVKLMSRVELPRIQTLALDEGSRTSAALSRILLQRQYGVRPELLPLPIDEAWQTADADAVLIIGDRAMNPQHQQQFGWEIDLGQWWYELTGLPFVFAMWAARGGIDSEQLSRIDQTLCKSRDAGVEASEDIARHSSESYGLTLQQGLDYFQQYLHFTLGSKERQALSLFREFAVGMDLAPSDLELQYHDC